MKQREKDLDTLLSKVIIYLLGQEMAWSKTTQNLAGGMEKLFLKSVNGSQTEKETFLEFELENDNFFK